MSLTRAELAAFGRHVITAVSASATTLAAVKLLTPDQAQSLVAGVSDISSGIAKIIVGLGPIIALVTAYFAKRTATPEAQAAAVAASPKAQQALDEIKAGQ